MEAIDSLITKYWSATEAALRRSMIFRLNVDRFGHSMRSAEEGNSISWLALAERDDSKDVYPLDLFCHDERNQTCHYRVSPSNYEKADYVRLFVTS